MSELFYFIDMLYESPLGVIGVIGLMWGIAFILVPIFQIVEYHLDCKKWGKDITDEIYRRM